jgi:hypothetical protein
MNTTTTNAKVNRATGEPRLASVASWAVLGASFALSASTWIAMAVLAGFTGSAHLPFTDVSLHVSWLMPVAVDGYVVVALVLWMSPVPASVAGFAKKNTYGAAGIGIVAQSAYHLLATQSETSELWRVALAAIVGALPPAVAALAVHMRALIRRETSTTVLPATVSTVPARPAPAPSTPPASTAIPAVAAPDKPSTDPTPHTRPEPAAVREVPTPADVAARITPAPASVPARPAPNRPATASTPKPRPRKPDTTTTARPLAAPATDTSVTAPEPAQLPLPYAVAPDLLTRAEKAARQYRTEHGTPITAGQLAIRLKVNSEQASQALAVLDLGPDSPTAPIPTVNGNPVKATR